MTSKIAGLAGLALMVLCAHAAAEPVASVRQIRVIDGDTIALGSEHIRLLDIDAPETHSPRCAAELAKGREATDYLRRLVAGAGGAAIERAGLDKYGRTLAHLSLDGRDAGDLMLRAGLAVRWRPGHAAWEERAAHWCPSR